MAITLAKSRYDSRHLSMGDRPSHIYAYYVTGRGHFPLDMLRYDATWPSTSEDAACIEHYPRDTGTSQLRCVRLHSHSKPTIERWDSFGWSVGNTKLD